MFKTILEKQFEKLKNPECLKIYKDFLRDMYFKNILIKSNWKRWFRKASD